MGKFKKLAVIGDPIAHSKSPAMQQAAIRGMRLEASYEPLLIPAGKISQIKKYQKLGFSGFNVTIPHKQAIVRYCQRLTPVARAVGAVNTFYQSGKYWWGDNTDVAGFMNAIREMAPVRKNQKALVFGAGGASLAIVYAFLKLGLETVYLCNRTPAKAMRIKKKFHASRIQVIAWRESEIKKAMAQAFWVVNTTALGLGRLKQRSPVPRSDFFKKSQMVIDLVYGNQPTLFLKQAGKRGAKIQNGLPMLLHQGALSFRCFFKKKAPLKVMRRALGL